MRMDFNPRTPCGVRQATKQIRRGLLHFNPRTPCGVRRPRLTAHCRRMITKRFQSTHPLRGATRFPLPLCRGECYFNPRTPCGVRPLCVCALTLCVWISIHAPLAGCDSKTVCKRRRSFVFQSTHPLRGATFFARSTNDASVISIHAPLAGCDFCSKMLPQLTL